MSSGWSEDAKRYIVRMSAIFATYTVVLFGVNILDNRFDLPQWQRLTLSLLPVIPAVLMIFVILSFVRTMDEVWQKIIAESTIIAACVVGITTFTLGFMEGVIDLPNGILIWIWPAMIGLQGISMSIVRLRYS